MRVSGQQQVFRLPRLLSLVVTPALLLLAGCVTAPVDATLRQRLDDSTGATVTTLMEPVAFYRAQPMLAANARDYVYMGPVEVNRSGRHQYMLWTAYRSTIDRVTGTGFPVPTRVFLMLDGEPMELSVSEYSSSDAAEFRDWLYGSPVVGGNNVMYDVTRDQLLAITAASEVRVITDDGKATAEFGVWRNSYSEFEGFSKYLRGDLSGRLALVDE